MLERLKAKRRRKKFYKDMAKRGATLVLPGDPEHLYFCHFRWDDADSGTSSHSCSVHGTDPNHDVHICCCGETWATWWEEERRFEEPPDLTDANCIWPGHPDRFVHANGTRRCSEETCKGYIEEPEFPYSIINSPGPYKPPDDIFQE